MTHSPASRQTKPATYFIAGEIVILVDHEEEVEATPEAARSLLEAAINNARSLISNATFIRADAVFQILLNHNPPLQMRIIPFFASSRALPFRNAPSAFSLIVIEALNIYQNPDIGPVAQQARFYDAETGSIQTFGGHIDAINQLVGAIGNRITDTVTLRSASPNWFSQAYPLDGRGGSPSSYPIDAGDIQNLGGTARLDIASIDIIPGSLPSLAAEDLGAGVEVIVLDAIPPENEILVAYNKYGNRNWLLTALRDGVDGGPGLTTEYANSSGIILPLENAPPVEYHDYIMSDHGLFIAGIIRSIAPHARIHLIQVLNDHGVGSVTSVAQGIVRAFERANAGGGRTIINCSLGFTIPQPGEDVTALQSWELLFAALGADHIREWLNVLLKHEAESEWEKLLSRVTLAVASVFAWANSQDTWIVAAAGNDANDIKIDSTIPGWTGLTRPLPHLPAALPFVIGVGALDGGGAPTYYSNTSDVTVLTVQIGPDGYATFGGTSSNPPSEDSLAPAEPDRSMLGVYIGNIPELSPAPHRPIGSGTPTTHGWAWWSGTSFSTAVMSAILARFATQQSGSPVTLDAVRTDLQDGKSLTDLGYHVAVRQNT